MSDQIKFDNLFNSSSFDQGTKELAKFLERITDEITKAEIAAEDLTKALGAKLKNEIQQLSSVSKNLNKEMLDMNAKMNQFQTTVSNTKKVLSDYEKENARLRLELDRLKTAQAQVNTATSNSGTTFKAMAQSLIGVSTGAALVHQGIEILRKQLILAVQSSIDFEQAMKEVQAISRASDEQLASLSANANKLGAATEKTAVEVAGLQKELAKLGFTSTEIIASSQAIVDLSTATGENLAGSATVAAATLRAFGLSASEMTRVVDVMAGSFVRSGLDLEKFRESMKLVAPIAKATGVELEVTTAALSKLADAGLSGSLAGTATRNLLSSLSDPTEKLTKRLGQLNPTLADGVKNSEELILALKTLGQANIDLAEANELVDVRAKTAFFILINQANAIEALTREYKSLTGEGQRIAEMMRDTLSNDIEIAESAFDALRRNLVDGGMPAMREFVQVTTQVIEGFRLLSEGAIEFNGFLGDFINYWKSIVTGLAETWGVIFDVADGLFNISEALEQVKFASKELRFKEMADEAASSTKVFSDAITLIELEPLVNEFEKLNAKVNKTQEDYDKLNELSVKLRMNFGMDAVAVDKLTKEHFLNTEALKRTIDAKRREALLTSESIRTRLQQIDAEIIYNNLAKDNIEKITLVSQRIEEQAKISEKNNDLIREKNILLGALNNALIDTSVNGWSVYTKAIKEANKEEENGEDQFEATIKILNKKLDREILSAKIKEEEAEKSKKLHDEAIKLRDAEIESDQSYIDGKQKLVDTQNKIVSDLIGLEKDLFEEDKKFADKQLDNLEKFNKEQDKLREEADKAEKQKAEEKRQRTIRVAEQTAQELAKIVKFTFDNNQLMREKELAEIDDWENEQTRLMGDNEDAKLRIQEQAESRRREIRRKQALDNRAETLFQIAIDTAANVVRSILQNGGFPAGIPFGLAAAALGAAQAALVASRPLPAFAKGTDNSPEGFAHVGEKGRELVRDGKSGAWSITPDKTTVTYLTKGSQVIPNAQTEMILKNDPNVLADNYLKNKVVQVSTPQVDYNKIGEQFDKSISKIPINITNFDENGVANFVVKKSVRLKRLNKRY